VAKGYNEEEEIDFDEMYSHVPKLDVVRLFLAYATMSVFKVFQIDVKSSFVNIFINEEVYVSQ